MEVATVTQSQEFSRQATRLGDLRLDGAQRVAELTMLGAL